ncbi:hypothetical protein LTR84_004659 [Exophiala bonariae]|uniref:Nitroreductase domain-containing protein n=1 Tax=Exophiala bonariae TaxID=1690606 RepID=A0AAV9NMH7_9EURO|nr:hypothetical protein LTR84_004659 [Exophiala bonariae]
MSSSPAALDGFLNPIESRLSCYGLTNSSPIPDSKIRSIVEFAIKNAPSAFNVQSARAVILLKADHEKLWDIADKHLKAAMPEPAYQALAPRVKMFRAAYGSVLWFEDQDALDALKEKNPAIQASVAEWSHHSSGMHQFIAWTAFELEGLGCNLQHYNFMPQFSAEVASEWKLPESWKLLSQLVFGTPTDGLKRSRERTYLPVEDRVKVFGEK